MLNTVSESLLDEIGVLRVRDDGDFFNDVGMSADDAQKEETENHAEAIALTFCLFHNILQSRKIRNLHETWRGLKALEMDAGLDFPHTLNNTLIN